MIPLHELLNRIRWDPAYRGARFDLAYEDHLAPSLVHVPFEQITLEPGNHFSFQCVTPDGDPVTIPLHRVRTVYRDGEPIWQRPWRPPHR
jgi:uncharacterized protein (UPF0248 family)